MKPETVNKERNNKPSIFTQKLIKQIITLSNVTETQMIEHWNTALAKKSPYREHLLKTKLIKEKEYQNALGNIAGLTYVDEIPELTIESRDLFTSNIPIRFSKKFIFFPYTIAPKNLVLVVSKPWPTSSYEEAANALGYIHYSLVLTTEKIILDAINHCYDRESGSAEEAAEVLEEDENLSFLNHFSSEETEDLLDVEDEEPIKKLMNSILFQSVKDGSSDIHIDPSSKRTVVRNRVDGVLRQITKVPKQGHMPLLNRVKVMSGLDISVKNKPQDGRTMILLAGNKIDVRVSIIPTVHGERAVLRLLNQSLGINSLRGLGISDHMSDQIDKIMHQPHGILLVTGPTGSGKTTTLYSALNQINAEENNIVTIEDPVEYRIGAYGQMQVNEKIGVTFAKGLRSMLRQDPDVIMVGEIRDTETAQIAIQASLTGHLVLSTLHTNDAASSLVRLIDMGIEPFLVSSTVTAIMAQRLVRKICSSCKTSFSISSTELKKRGFDKELLADFEGKLWKGEGCSKCLDTGYQGRMGVYELLVMNDSIRKAVVSSIDTSILKKAALRTGMKGLKYDCAEKVLKGLTTLEEMMRVVFSEINTEHEPL